jgi:hypothetical protein
MADAEDVRRLALDLPEVEEIDSDGFDFRVGGKGFVWSYPERRPRRIRTDIAVLYVGDEAEKQALLLGEPAIFFTAPEYNNLPLVLVRLAEVDVRRLTELVTDAWRMRAPEALAARFSGDELPGLAVIPVRAAAIAAASAGMAPATAMPARVSRCPRVPGLAGANGQGRGCDSEALRWASM